MIAITLFSGILSIRAFAITCVEDHFQKLKASEAPPSEDSCPYVAMSMLLSYYDAYWNDQFVIDDY